MTNKLDIIIETLTEYEINNDLKSGTLFHAIQEVVDSLRSVDETISNYYTWGGDENEILVNVHGEIENSLGLFKSTHGIKKKEIANELSD